jgi:hypothetical protein
MLSHAQPPDYGIYLGAPAMGCENRKHERHYVQAVDRDCFALVPPSANLAS